MGFFTDLIISKATSHFSKIDFSKPTGTCDRCGHTTYEMKGDPSVDVCPVCKVMRLMLLLQIPTVQAPNIMDEIIKMLEAKNKIKL